VNPVAARQFEARAGTLDFARDTTERPARDKSRPGAVETKLFLAGGRGIGLGINSLQGFCLGRRFCSRRLGFRSGRIPRFSATVQARPEKKAAKKDSQPASSHTARSFSHEANGKKETAGRQGRLSFARVFMPGETTCLEAG